MDLEAIRQQVKNLLKANTTSGYSAFLKRRYSYIAPDVKKYPYQWFWDTCFHAFILCELGEYEIAKENIYSLFAKQEENGFVGHMLFWNKYFPRYILEVLQVKPTLRHIRPSMTSLIQPTFVAQVVLRIYEGTKDKVFVEELLPKIKKYMDWLAENRDFQGDGLLSIISPFESGMDWKPSFDSVVGFRHGRADKSLYRKVMWRELKNFLYRYDLKKIAKAHYFLVKEVGLNTIYAQDLQALEKLCTLFDDEDGKKYKDRFEKVSKSILEKMYDPTSAAFYDLESVTGRQLKVLTGTIFFPIVLPNVSEDIAKEIITKHLFNPKEFATPYPIPSTALSELSFYPFQSDYLWRGPTWAVFNWFIYHSLKERGYTAEAKILKKSLQELIEKSGFREYYHPMTGEGYGAKEFTWTGLILDMT